MSPEDLEKKNSQKLLRDAVCGAAASLEPMRERFATAYRISGIKGVEKIVFAPNLQERIQKLKQVAPAFETANPNANFTDQHALGWMREMANVFAEIDEAYHADLRRENPDVKKAVMTATSFFTDLIGQDKLSDIWLEEVELSMDEGSWKVTLSALAPARQVPNTLSAVLAGPQDTRMYKVFVVDAKTGVVKSMKMR